METYYESSFATSSQRHKYPSTNRGATTTTISRVLRGCYARLGWIAITHMLHVHAHAYDKNVTYGGTCFLGGELEIVRAFAEHQPKQVQLLRA